MAETKKKLTMAELLKTAEKKYDLAVGTLDSIASDVKFISTGNMAVDYAIGGASGGIPLGRVVELYGPPSSGKTTLATQAAANLQKIILSGGDESLGIMATDRILYLDYEQAFDAAYARALGLDTSHDSFLFTQPDTLEAGMDFMLTAFKTGEVRLALVDSVAAMTPSAQAEADSVGKSLPAVQAKIMKVVGTNLNPILKEHNGTVIFINHEIEKMEMGGARRPGMPVATSTPGGIALKFFSSVRVQFRQIRNIKGTIIDPLTKEPVETPVATDVKVKVVKNKVAPPFRECSVRVRFGRGFDEFWTAIQILVANKKLIYATGRWYFHNVIEEVPADWMPREAKGTKRPYIHGEGKVFAAADENPEWRGALIAVAKRVAKENAASLADVAKFGVSLPEEDEDGPTSDELDDLLPSTSDGNRISI